MVAEPGIEPGTRGFSIRHSIYFALLRITTIFLKPAITLIKTYYNSILLNMLNRQSYAIILSLLVTHWVTQI